MTRQTDILSTAFARASRSGLLQSFAAKASDMLPVLDFAGLLLTSLLSGYGYRVLAATRDIGPPLDPSLSVLGWIAAALGPFMLYDAQFSEQVRALRTGAVLSGFLRRACMFLGVIAAIGFSGAWLDQAPPFWIALWVVLALLVTGTTRLILAGALRAIGPDAPPLIPARRAHGTDQDWSVTLLVDRPIRRWSAVMKATKDFVLAALICLTLLPLLALIALVIRLDSPGPILFKQRRHGFNNAEFDIYKFRTMRSDPLGTHASLQQTVRGDTRITRVGGFLRKWSLDELPQVFNVLEGSMSLVGPRPHAVNMRTEAQLGEEITPVYPHRHRVKPGITGWSQVNGARGATDTVEQLRRRVELDLHYIEHWSLLLDIKILTRTFKAVVRATNAY